MATIGAGRYIVGEDIPLGKYSLKALAGKGNVIYKNDAGDDCKIFFYAANDLQNTYYGLTLFDRSVMIIETGLVLEIKKAEPIVIE